MIPLESLVAIPPLAAASGWWALRRRGMDRWLPGYLTRSRERADPEPTSPIHVLLCIADHYEPHLGGASNRLARKRVARWTHDYPRLFRAFRDSDGRPPRHSFFYPVEDYRPQLINALTPICRAGFGEVEIHLHHDNDTAANLRATLLRARDALSDQHGMLARDRRTGEIRYGFIHGNWALANSCPGGRWCGVNGELDILRETGCYADFTLPSTPSRAQTRTINSIYYATGDPRRPCPHDHGCPVTARVRPTNDLMLIQGPLLLNWSARKWGVLPRVENGCIQGNQPATINRLRHWLRARVQVATRPDWYFVKLHTHGANEANMPVLLGEPMVQFHRDLAHLAATKPNFHFHYVTAREMYNLARAAADGWQGAVDVVRDYELEWNGSTRPVHTARSEGDRSTSPSRDVSSPVVTQALSPITDLT